MDRRKFINGTLTSFVGLMAIPMNAFGRTEASPISPVSPAKAEKFVIVKDYQSLTHPGKSYKSAKEFWNDHPDQAYDSIRNQASQGALLESRSELLKDGKTIRLMKVFKSENDWHQFFARLDHLAKENGIVQRVNLKKVG